MVHALVCVNVDPHVGVVRRDHSLSDIKLSYKIIKLEHDNIQLYITNSHTHSYLPAPSPLWGTHQL